MLRLVTRTMMVLVMVLLCGRTDDALAQLPETSFDVYATAASIDDGATGVDLSTTLTFTLSAPLPDDATLEAFGFDSLDDLLLELGDADIVSSSLNDDRTEVSYELALAEDTDYGVGFWGLEYNFESETNFTYAFKPFAVNFTTAESFGDISITGELLVDPEEFPNADPDFSHALVMVQGTDDDNAYITVVPDASNMYALDIVRPGGYYVWAFGMNIQTVAGVGVFTSFTGFHDADGDGEVGGLELLEDVFTVEAGATVTADVTMLGYFTPTPNPVEAQPEVPATALGTAAPNPVHTTVAISYRLGTPQSVRLAVYDLLGREVAVLADGMQSGGSHTVTFDAAGLPGGVYFYRLETAHQVEARSLVIVR